MKLLLLAVAVAVAGCGSKHPITTQDSGAEDVTAVGTPAAAQAQDDAASETSADAPEQVLFHCMTDAMYCKEYHDVSAPDAEACEPGACPTPPEPTDVCVIAPGVWEYYYRYVVPVEGRDGGIPLGPLPPADCVHP